MPKQKQKASGSGSKRFFIILLIMLIIASLCGLAGYTIYQINNMKSAMQHKNEDSTSALPKKAVPPSPPIYVPLETFTVSLKPGENDSDRVLYIGLTLRLKDEKAKAALQQFLPEVRSRLLLLFSQQTGDELATDNGKIELMKKIKEVVNRPLTDNHDLIVTDVLFNAFILR